MPHAISMCCSQGRAQELRSRTAGPEQGRVMARAGAMLWSAGEGRRETQSHSTERRAGGGPVAARSGWRDATDSETDRMATRAGTIPYPHKNA